MRRPWQTKQRPPRIQSLTHARTSAAASSDWIGLDALERLRWVEAMTVALAGNDTCLVQHARACGLSITGRSPPVEREKPVPTPATEP
ncbi:hypothetical protein NSND_60180 [Nitrospira sp. ND1]|nr:hypothetical protein NSND_60180 [Nitrospira sp. ND1]